MGEFYAIYYLYNFKTMNYFINPKSATLEETYDTTVSSSTEITLNVDTVAIQVSAIDKGIFLAWGRTASSSDFDEFISKDTTREFIVPDEQTTVQFIEESATAKLVLIEK